MIEIENFGFMLNEDKAKLDSIPTDTLLTKVEADRLYLSAGDTNTVVNAADKDSEGNVISETYIKKSELKNFLAGVQVDEKGVTILNGEGTPVIILPVVAPKSNS